MEFTPKDYMDLGAAALIVLLFIYITLITLKGFKPILKRMEENSILSSEVIRNNTAAFDEMAKSNNNVAKALELLQNTFISVPIAVDKLDQRVERMHETINKLDERTIACNRK